MLIVWINYTTCVFLYHVFKNFLIISIEYFYILIRNYYPSKKEVIYQETNGEKVPVTQSIIKPQIEGAIITAVGAKDSVIKTNIVQAIEAATGLATHKIQVFEMVN